MDSTYTQSMKSHIKQLESELRGLTDILQERPLSKYEYRASERTVQIIIGACIGIAKHWCKQLGQPAPESAYAAFQMLSDSGIEEVKQTRWKQIIGMRNALVHDYLNIDKEIIEHLIRERHYQSLVQFALTGLEGLSQSK